MAISLRDHAARFPIARSAHKGHSGKSSPGVRPDMSNLPLTKEEKAAAREQRFVIRLLDADDLADVKRIAKVSGMDDMSVVLRAIGTGIAGELRSGRAGRHLVVSNKMPGRGISQRGRTFTFALDAHTMALATRLSNKWPCDGKPIPVSLLLSDFLWTGLAMFEFEWFGSTHWLTAGIGRIVSDTLFPRESIAEQEAA